VLRRGRAQAQGRQRRMSARAAVHAGSGDACASPVRAALRELRVGGSSSSTSEHQPTHHHSTGYAGMDVDGGPGGGATEPLAYPTGPDSALTDDCSFDSAAGPPVSAALNMRAVPLHPAGGAQQPDPSQAAVQLTDMPEPGVWRAASAASQPGCTPAATSTCAAGEQHIVTAAVAPGCVVVALSKHSALQVLAVVSKPGSPDGSLGVGGHTPLSGRKRGRALWHVQPAGVVPIQAEVSCLEVQAAPSPMLPPGAPPGSQAYWLLTGDRSPAVTLALLTLSRHGALLHHAQLARAVLPARMQAGWDAAVGGPAVQAVPQSVTLCQSAVAAPAATFVQPPAGSAPAPAASGRTPPATPAASFTAQSCTHTVQWLVGYRQGSAALFECVVRAPPAFATHPGLGAPPGAAEAAYKPAPAAAQLLWHSKLGQQPIDLCSLAPITSSAGSSSAGGSPSSGSAAGGASPARAAWSPVLAVGSSTGLLHVSPFNARVSWQQLGVREAGHACGLVLPPTASHLLLASASAGSFGREGGAAAAAAAAASLAGAGACTGAGASGGGGAAAGKPLVLAAHHELVNLGCQLQQLCSGGGASPARHHHLPARSRTCSIRGCQAPAGAPHHQAAGVLRH